jgi:glutathione-regulated potassium-efflux system ancillary protein KefC
MELLWIGTAYAVGLVASRLFLPPLVGYLVAGYLLNLLGVRPYAPLEQLAETGILLLLFTVGLKLRLSALARREVLGVGGLHLLAVAGICGLVFLGMDSRWTGGLVLGIGLAFSSTVLAIKVLEDNGELGTFHGRTVLGILILQDVVAVALLAVAGGERPTWWALGFLGLPLVRPLAVRVFEASRSDELRLLLGLTLALAGGQLAHRVGISHDLGALLMGMLLAGHPDTDDLAKKLWGLKEVFLVAFFLQIGLAGLPSRDETLQSVGLLALLPLQGMLFFGLLLVVGLRARTAFVSSLALMTYSEFALIASSVIIDAGALEASWKPVLGFAVAGSLALAAPLNRHSHRLFTRLEPMLARYERRSVRHPDRVPISTGASEWLVVGMGRTGMAAYLTLETQGFRVMGLDADPICVRRLRDEGRRVLYGDAEDPELWEHLALDRVKAVIFSVPDFGARGLGIGQLRARGFKGIIGATAFHPDEDPLLYRAGADLVFHPLSEAGERLAERMIERRRAADAQAADADRTAKAPPSQGRRKRLFDLSKELTMTSDQAAASIQPTLKQDDLHE